MKICNHGTCLSRALFLLGGLMSLSAIHAADSQQYRGFTIDVSGSGNFRISMPFVQQRRNR